MKKLISFVIVGMMTLSMLFGMTVFADEDEAEAGATSLIDIDMLSDDYDESSGEMMDVLADLFESSGLMEILNYDWDGLKEELNAKAEAGEEITLEDTMPEVYLNFMAAMINSPDNDARSEDAPTLEYKCEGNTLYLVNIFSEDVSHEDAKEAAEKDAKQFEDIEALESILEMFEGTADDYPSINANDLSVCIQYLTADGEVVKDIDYTYEDLYNIVRSDDEAVSDDGISPAP